MEDEQNTSATARDILKLLQLGKTVTVQVSTPEEFANLRSRISSLKSEEDKIVIGLGMAEDAPSMMSSCRPCGIYKDDYGRDAKEHGTGYECTFRFGEKAAPKSYKLISVD